MEKYLKNNNEFLLLYLLKSHHYDQKLMSFLKNISIERNKKICYILSRQPYKYFSEELENNGIPLNNFHFVDVLGNYSDESNENSRCTYLGGFDLKKLMVVAKELVLENDCTYILFDDINSMLHFTQAQEIQFLTNQMKTCKKYGQIKKIFLINKDEELVGEESENLTEDLIMFADRTIDV